jgi:transcriptional regulator with XRE-family HTH domain
MTTSKLQRWVNESPARAREYARESLIIEVSEEIFAALEASNLSKAELAEILGTSKSHISQLLSGARNMTLRSLADIGFALKRKPCFKLLKESQHVAWIDEMDFGVRPRLQVHITGVTVEQKDQLSLLTEACNKPSLRDEMEAADADAA